MCVFAAVAAVLAAVGVPGLPQSVAVASSSPVLNWTRQAPAASLPARYGASMAYDAATGNVVLFSGNDAGNGAVAGTWTWDGSTWTQLFPKTRPSPRFGASMAYDAATGNMVLFGGIAGGDRGVKGDTWTWNGSTWTKQAPASSPPVRFEATMAYDAATGNVVLFGGTARHGALGDTWTWDGTTWTQQHPAASPPPGSARRWLMTRLPATWSCRRRNGGSWRHLDLGRHHLDPAAPGGQPVAPVRRVDGLRRRHRQRGPVRR